MSEKFTFIDLFSGIGAFHIAMKNLGGKCLFASEIDKECIKTYFENFHINSDHDITKVNEEDIPHHDVLCAGFPCQAFSKAGKQGGINDARGTLFFDIARILKYHHTRYIILENVRNLIAHDDGKTRKTIRNILKNLGYRLTEKPLILSPYQFGIPQNRERVFILGYYDPKNIEIPLQIDLPPLKTKNDNSIFDILDINYNSGLTKYEEKCLSIWNDFLYFIDKKNIGFPIWADYFKIGPSSDMPDWKKEFVIKNNNLYKRYKSQIDLWLKKYSNLNCLNPTQHKFERQAGEDLSSIYDGVIQFRPSGIRVKRPNVFPALVAIIQVPIIGSQKRHLSVRECARLQSFPESYSLNSNDKIAYKQLGNSANVKIIQTITDILMNKYK